MVALNDWPWRDHARRHPDRSAMIAGNRQLSWFALAQQVDALAAGFLCQGVYTGCGVIMKAVNSQQAALAYLALLQCGVRLLPLNPRIPQAQIDVLLPGLNIDFALILSGTPLPGVAALFLHSQQKAVSCPWQPQALATMTLTSGSSGVAKAAVHTFQAHLASAAGVVEKLCFSAEDSWLLSLPLYHVSGQGIIWRWLRAGARLVLAEATPLPQALEQSTFASLVPTQLLRLLQQPRRPQHLRTLLLGGATIPVGLACGAEALGIACWCGYGMTETASTITAKRADESGSVGLPLAGHRIRVVDGEVQIQSDALASGYWQQGQLLPLVNDKGWFATRDGGYFNADGLQLTGRLDNQFFSGGEGIQPEQIEAVLQTHPAVEQVFIVPEWDLEFGHRPVALVRLKHAVPLAALADWAASHLAGFQRPVSWYPLPEPDGGGIKISRQWLRTWLANRQRME
ncbi:o-succinylbenzoate--CoA ligase [Erwinia tracheiphila]|uniref:O-succinylbenzoate--CoA ligase n=1 Tax=Erwinia tracheiphila TaxID=65700 RepID=A0A345CSQ1_9GAMM|nr:o-succinylbenzoate--CoA ligase [Erwinia tracheiphila]AXF76468.1 o-succinylbenzoate--CoA ligase [Erwinia tracheiphila]UIA84867.1 o-succinylbenzoate--CoA ligase [Erwinia tracheiphila]UIA93462.1 o-succinylbenzoate--CoA ligase [Erwinia tracheiphila]